MAVSAPSLYGVFRVLLLSLFIVACNFIITLDVNSRLYYSFLIDAQGLEYSFFGATIGNEIKCGSQVIWHIAKFAH